MDNNPINTNIQPPAPQAVTNIGEQPPDGGNKKMLWIALGIVALLLVAGGLYWYFTNQQATKPSAKPTPSPAAQTVSTLEKELNSTSLDDLDKEFSTVDSDLGGL